jgi:hypothetical protein
MRLFQVIDVISYPFNCLILSFFGVEEPTNIPFWMDGDWTGFDFHCIPSHIEAWF